MANTSEQHDAITIHDRNLVVIAGAGSGKTRVLVERFIALLEANPHWPLNALVAITFTKKAAGEMRDRVRQEIEARARHQDVGGVWSARLQAMDSARIGTIHSLCETILRANAAPAGVAPDFEVLDEVEAQLLLGEVIQAVFQRIGEEGDISIKLFEFYDPYIVYQLLSREDLLRQHLPTLPDDLMHYWWQLWRDGRAIALKMLNEQADFIRALEWQPISRQFPDPNTDKLAGVWDRVRVIAGVLRDLSVSDDERYERLQELGKILLVGGSAKKWGDEETFKEAKSVLRNIRNMASQWLAFIGKPPDLDDERAAEILPLWHRLVTIVRDAYQDAKARRALLDFNDLEERTCRLLSDFPDVRERYQNQEFKHLLVDEFQDTNQAQWEIIQALADLNKGGTLFVVGDPKQSIYQFRGADVSVFGDVVSSIVAHGGSKLSLSRSFRTHKTLMAAFNHIFTHILSVDATSPTKSFEVSYDVMSAQRDENPVGVPLEFILLNKNSDPEEKRNADDNRRWEALVLGQRIQKLIENGLIIYDKEAQCHRSVRYDDIAILFQSLAEVTQYEDVFKQLGVPYITVAGRGYYARQEIWDALNLLKALHNPGDELALASALRSPLFNFSDDLLYALRAPLNHDPMPLWDAVVSGMVDDWDSLAADDLESLSRAAQILEPLQKLAGRVAISELLREILDKTGYLATLTGLPDGVRRRGNVEKLVAIAETSGKVTLGSFIRYLDELSEREVREGEVLLEATGNITLMSIHASKGLEFPIVIIASAHWKRSGNRTPVVMYDPVIGLTCAPPADDDAEENNEKTSAYAHQRAKQLKELREIAERRRLLYVAATRAQDMLIVSGVIQYDKDGLIKTDGFLSWLLDALNLIDISQDAEVTYDWGIARVLFPSYDEQEVEQLKDGALPHLELVDDNPIETPPLLEQLVIKRDTFARHLSATQIADLGAAHLAPKQEERRIFRQRFLGKILYDAPYHIEQITSSHLSRVSRRKIGEIVHDALRYWRFPNNTNDFQEILRSYAWQQGITRPQDMDYAIAEAQSLLLRFQESDVYHWIQASLSAGLPFYTELPFIYRTDKRIIHGVIDALFQDMNGLWRIVDYKTGYVPPNIDIYTHARQYFLQVGIYATAVREQFQHQIVPEVYIHYLRYTQTVPVLQNDWQTALLQLEDYLGDVMRDDEG